MRSAIILRGISATGKGTRVATMMEYLKSKYEHQSIMIDKVGDEVQKKPWQLAVAFPEIKLMFIGRWVKSNKSKLISWSSLDGISGYQDTLYQDIPKFFSDYSIVMEGYFGGKGTHVWPEHLCKSGIQNIRYFHFLYTDVEELQERCLGRSGSRIKGSCWGDNHAFLKEKVQLGEVEKFTNIFNSCNTGGKMEYTYHAFDESPQKMGTLALNFLDLKENALEFHRDWERFSSLRHTSGLEENHKKYLRYLTADTTNQVLVNMY